MRLRVLSLAALLCVGVVHSALAAPPSGDAGLPEQAEPSPLQSTPVSEPSASTEAKLGLNEKESLTKQTVLANEAEQLRDLRPAMLFLERTRFVLMPLRAYGKQNAVYEGQRFPLLFEGTPALHIPINNRLSELLAYDARGRYFTLWPYVSLTFMPTVRMSLDTLNVLTPSYRVGANFQWFLQRSHLGDNPDRVVVHGLRISFMHYSNGQGDCSFAEGEPDVSDSDTDEDPSTCRQAYRHARDGQSARWYRHNANLRAGSFSTNYVTIAYHARRVWLDGAPRDDNDLRPETRSLTAGLILNTIIAPWNGEGQKDLYPILNLRVEGRYEQILRWRSHAARSGPRYPTRISLELFAEYYAVDQKGRFRSDAYFPLRGGLELSFTWPRANDLGVYSSLSAGQDPYNIHFVQTTAWVHVVGFVVDLFARPRYGSGRRLLGAKPAATAVDAR